MLQIVWNLTKQWIFCQMLARFMAMELHKMVMLQKIWKYMQNTHLGILIRVFDNKINKIQRYNKKGFNCPKARKRMQDNCQSTSEKCLDAIAHAVIWYEDQTLMMHTFGWLHSFLRAVIYAKIFDCFISSTIARLTYNVKHIKE